MSETVSVIIPLYNAAPYVEKTINSILEQSYRDWNLYIVDDQSTDGSAAIAQKFATEHPDRIIYHQLEKKAGKPSIGKNVGISLSHGSLIAFMDHDDWWAPDHLERLVTAINHQPKTGLIGSNGYFYDDARATVLGTYQPTNRELTATEVRRLTLTKPPFLTSTCMLLRREAVEALGPIDEELGMSDDHELCLRIVASGQFEITALARPTIYRRWLHSSFSNSTKAMELIIKDVETIYGRFSASVNLSQEEKDLLAAWRWQFQKRWANYLVLQGRYREAREVYRQVIANGYSDQTVRWFTRLLGVLPPLARLVVRQKRRWSFTHPDIALSS